MWRVFLGCQGTWWWWVSKRLLRSSQPYPRPFLQTETLAKHLQGIRVLEVGLHAMGDAALKNLLHPGDEENLRVWVVNRENPLQ